MNHTSSVSVSIIIPVKSDYRVHSLITSLQHKNLHKQTRVEVIIVCNGSTRQFIAQVKARTKKLVNAHVLSIPTAHIALAKNAGIRASKGSFLYFLDSDCCIGSSFFTDMLESVALLAPHRNTVLMGKNVFIDTLGSTISTFDTKLRKTAYSNHTDRTYTPNLLVPREVFYRYGMFPLTQPLLPTGEDTTWGYFAIAQGLGLLYLPSIVVTHYSYESNSKIIRGWCRYGEARCYRIYFHLTHNGSYSFVSYLKAALGTYQTTTRHPTLTSTAMEYGYYLLRMLTVLKTSFFILYARFFLPTVFTLSFPKLSRTPVRNTASEAVSKVLKHSVFPPNKQGQFPNIVLRTHQELSAQIHTTLSSKKMVDAITAFLRSANCEVALAGPHQSIDFYSTTAHQPATMRLRVRLPQEKQRGSLILSSSELCSQSTWITESGSYPVKSDSVLFIPESGSGITSQYFFLNMHKDGCTGITCKEKYSGGYRDNTHPSRDRELHLPTKKKVPAQPRVFLDNDSLAFEYQTTHTLRFPKTLSKEVTKKILTLKPLSLATVTAFLQRNTLQYTQEKVVKIEIEQAGALFEPVKNKLVETLFGKDGFFETAEIQYTITSARTMPIKKSSAHKKVAT